MHTNAYCVSRVVGVLVILCISPVALGQAQRPEALTNLQPNLFEPSASGGSGSGSDGSTPILHESAKLTASDERWLDNFGWSISANGGVAVFGTPHDACRVGSNFSRCGSAYVFRYNGTDWMEEDKLIASDALRQDQFGHSVSVSGDTALVGAWQDDCAAGGTHTRCGSAYVFRFNETSWVEEQRLTASDAAIGGEFGISVSVSGETALVGAVWADCGEGIFCGSVYVFRFNGTRWVETQKLIPFDGAASDHFGISVSMSGNIAVVGATWDDCQAGDRCGSVYVFRTDGDGWIGEQKLTAFDARRSDQFGISVAVSGDIIMVGQLVRTARREMIAVRRMSIGSTEPVGLRGKS